MYSPCETQGNPPSLNNAQNRAVATHDSLGLQTRLVQRCLRLYVSVFYTCATPTRVGLAPHPFRNIAGVVSRCVPLGYFFRDVWPARVP